MTDNMVWTPELENKFEALWNQTDPVLSTAAIGKKLGVSKSAITGKRARMNLPTRASPIARRQKPLIPDQRPPPSRALPSPLPAAPTLLAIARGPGVASPPPRPVAPVPSFHRGACVFPIGEPGTSGFRFCGDAAQTSKPYCPEHCRIAYVKVRDTRDEEAA